MPKGQRQRLFTKEFSKGDKVHIIRYEHGWLDGSVSGIITEISDFSCTVKSKNGSLYEINHPRDIQKAI